jgi:hypothetical protein
MTAPTSSLGMQNWYTTTLSAGCGATDTTIYLNATPTPTEGYLIIDPNNPGTTAEVIHYTSIGSGTVVLPGTGDRGLDGTTAQSHAQGTTVVMNYTTSHFTALQTGDALNTGAISTKIITNPYKFSVYLAASSVSVTSNAASLITCDTKQFDTGTNYSVSTGLFTAPISGFYWIHGTILFTSTLSLHQGGAQLFKNGSLLVEGDFNSGASVQAGFSVGRLLQLAANDTIGLYQTNTSGSSVTVAGGSTDYTFFEGFLVSVT